MEFKEAVRSYLDTYGGKKYTKGSKVKPDYKRAYMPKSKVHRTDGIILKKGSEFKLPRQVVSLDDYNKLARKKNLKKGARPKVYSTEKVAFVDGKERSLPTKVVSHKEYEELRKAKPKRTWWVSR